MRKKDDRMAGFNSPVAHYERKAAMGNLDGRYEGSPDAWTDSPSDAEHAKARAKAEAEAKENASRTVALAGVLVPPAPNQFAGAKSGWRVTLGTSPDWAQVVVSSLAVGQLRLSGEPGPDPRPRVGFWRQDRRRALSWTVEGRRVVAIEQYWREGSRKRAEGSPGEWEFMVDPTFA